MAKGSQGFQSFVVLIARVFISVIFIVAGIQKIIQYDAMSLMIAKTTIPWANWVLIAAIVCELGGGLMVLFGFFARFGAFLLLVFVAAVTFFFHSFWDFQGVDAVNQTHHFLKNLSMAGGLLYVIAYGSGCFGFDGMRKRAKAA